MEIFPVRAQDLQGLIKIEEIIFPFFLVVETHPGPAHRPQGPHLPQGDAVLLAEPFQGGEQVLAFGQAAHKTPSRLRQYCQHGLSFLLD